MYLSYIHLPASLSGVERDFERDVGLACIEIDSLVEIEQISELRRRFECNYAEVEGWRVVVTVDNLVPHVEKRVGRGR